MKLTLVLLALVALSNTASATPLLRNKVRDLKKDKGASASDGSEEFTGLINERHSCVTDFETEKARMPDPAITEYGNDGSLECYADPVNGCAGGCCRTSRVYFVCDSDGTAIPSLPCICNANTKEPATNPPQPDPPTLLADGMGFVGNMTMNATALEGEDTMMPTPVARNVDVFD